MGGLFSRWLTGGWIYEWLFGENAKQKSSSQKTITATAIDAGNVSMSGDSKATAAAFGSGKSSSGGENVQATALRARGEAKLEGNAQIKAIARGQDVDYSKAHFIDAIKKRLNIPDEKIQELLEELEEKFGVYQLYDLQHVTPEQLRTLNSLIGVKLDQFIDYVKETRDYYQGVDQARDPPFGLYN